MLGRNYERRMERTWTMQRADLLFVGAAAEQCKTGTLPIDHGPVGLFHRGPHRASVPRAIGQLGSQCAEGCVCVVRASVWR